MPEVENAAAGAEGTGEGEPNTVNKDEGADGAAVAGEGKEGEGEPAPKESDSTEGDGDLDKEPSVRARKTAKDFIIERQARKIEKLKQGDGAGKSDEGKEGEDDPDEDDVDPEDEKVIAKVASKMLAPIFEERIEAEDKAEVQGFITVHPEFKPYEARVMRDMKHPSRRLVPIEDLFYAAAGPDLMKIGARKAKEAEDEAARSGTGGGTVRTEEGGKPDWANMGKEDFEKQKLDILHPKA